MVVITAVVVIFVLVLIFAYASIRILREYERGVVFTLGRYTGTKGPGLFLLVPFVQQMVRVRSARRRRGGSTAGRDFP